MEKEKFEFGYLHPEVKVVLFKARQVLCQSGLENYTKGEDIEFGETE